MQAASIFKILRPAEWQAFGSARHFEGSTDDLRDGFIHFSTVAQVSGTLSRHFTSEQEIVILRVASAPLGNALRWEPSRQGTLFPHLYRPLRIEEVQESWTLQRGADGFDLAVLGAAPYPP
jgi:uncharacterized protein (DUF952 family)